MCVSLSTCVMFCNPFTVILRACLEDKGIQGFYFGLKQLRSTLVQALTIQITEQTNFNSYEWNKQTVHI